MINRSLIRIKTIQILYSYLLSRSDFQLQPAPPTTSADRDSQFAYSVYLDLLVLLFKLSSTPLGTNSGILLPTDPVIRKNRVAKALYDNGDVKAVLAGRRDRFDLFDSALPEISASVAASAVYGDYKRKRKLEMADDVKFWNTIFTTVIRKSKTVERALRRDENFTHLGFENGMKLFTDTLMSFDDSHLSYIRARKDLDKSLTLAYNLYNALLILPVHITDLQARRLDANKHKYVPTADDLNPNMRFVDNLYVQAIRDCAELNDYIADNADADPSSWRDSDILFATLLDRITATEAYAAYMESAGGDFATDAAFWRDMMRTVVLPSDELAEAMETKSVYWNDDLDIMGTFVLKTIRRSYAPAGTDDDGDDSSPDREQHPGKVRLLPKFMNGQDEVFGAQLFEYVVANRELYRSYIDRFIDTTQWDTERLAFMDIVVMMTAIAELVNFPSIPVPVTLNEYIEIANDYSTARSGQFVHGILSSVIKYLNDEGIISKK